jgi:hypothetical protein
MLAGTMLAAIVYGLTPDEKWNARHNPQGPEHRTGWLTVIGVVLALAIGAGVLMATIAFVSQRAFELAQERHQAAAGAAGRAPQGSSARPIQ